MLSLLRLPTTGCSKTVSLVNLKTMRAFRRAFPISLGLTALALVLCAPRASADRVGYSKELLEEYFRKEVAKTHVPGAALIITNAEHTQLSLVTGNYPSVDSPQIIGSTTKSFTALAIMQLVEKGVVALDTPAVEYIPRRLRLADVTVRELLNHTSGFGTNQRLKNFKVGQHRGSFEYANVNYSLLGEIIEQVSGESYADYLQKNILDPLGMTHTYFDLATAKADGLVPGYRNWFGFNIAQEMPYPGHFGPESLAAGYLITSPNDLATYARMYLDGGAGIISQQSIEQMWQGAPDYGFGWFVGERKIHHAGMVENYVSSIAMVPERGLAAVILVPAQDYFVASPMFEHIEDGVVAQLNGQSPPPAQSSYWLRHLGINIVYLGVLGLAAIPLIRTRRWREKPYPLAVDLAIHLGLPAVMCLLPLAAGSTWRMVRLFVPDAFWVTTVSVVGLLAGGVWKLRDALKPRRA